MQDLQSSVDMKTTPEKINLCTLWLLGLLLLALPACPSFAAGTTITPAEVRQYLADYLEDNRGFLPQAEIRIVSLDVPGSFTLPPGEVSCEIIPSDPQILTSRRFTFIFRVDGRVVRNNAYRAELEARAPVAVAAVDLSRGVVLAESDINLVEMDLARLRNPGFDPQDLVGKVLKRSLRMGQALDRSQIEEPSLVNRGDLVTIVARRGAMELTATGLARKDGKLGEFIEIRNTSSQKDILCQVVAPGLVQVEF